MKKIKSLADQLQTRLYIVFGWFIVSIVMGLYCLYEPSDIGVGIVALGFLIFNVFTTLYNLITNSAKRIIEESKK